MSALLRLERASLRYGQILGLSPTSFELPEGGGITGLLGPNGSGKSTLIQMVSGLLPPSSGTVEVFGQAPFRNPAVLARIGLVPEGDRFPTGLKARRWLRMMGELSGLQGTALEAALEETLALVGMEHRADLPFAAMSKGMRQRIRLAQALLHGPDLLILDEPFNGLDPEARLTLMDLLRRLAAGSTRVLVSSHILSEVAQLTDRILLLFRGRLLAEGSVQEIRELLALSQGNVVRLDRPAGEPLDILVNGCLVARGEVVVVNDRFGVRIVEIVSPEERIKRLR